MRCCQTFAQAFKLFTLCILKIALMEEAECAHVEGARTHTHSCETDTHTLSLHHEVLEWVTH